MKRASCREAVAWIARNDDEGSPDALEVDTVRGMLTVVLTADLFGVDAERVARDVVRYRMKRAIEERAAEGG